MAKYTSQYTEFGFYVGGKLRKFHHGKYETNVQQEIKFLDDNKHVNRVDDPKVEKKVEEKQTEVAKKAPATKRKSSGK